MMNLEQLQPNAAVRGIVPDGTVTVISVQWHGSEALELTYKTATGKLGWRSDLPARRTSSGKLLSRGVRGVLMVMVLCFVWYRKPNAFA